MSHLVYESLLRLAKAGAAVVVGAVVYAVMVGPLGATPTPELLLLSWLSGGALILLVETSPIRGASDTHGPGRFARLTRRPRAHTIRDRAASRKGAERRAGHRFRSLAGFDTPVAEPHHGGSAPRYVLPRTLHLDKRRVTGNP